MYINEIFSNWLVAIGGGLTLWPLFGLAVSLWIIKKIIDEFKF
jgi:hypothetical protein